MKKYLIISLILALISSLVYFSGDSGETIRFGAVGSSNLTNSNDTDGNSTATTASVTPTSNALVLISIATRTNITADPNIPTVTGNSLTWEVVQSIVYDTTGASRKRLTVLRALGASPSTGTISIDFGGQNQTDVVWSVSEFTGVDTSGSNGSGAIVQSNSTFNATLASSYSIALGAFSSTNNATFGAFAGSGTATLPATAGSGFTILGSEATASGGALVVDEYKSTNDTGVDISWSGNTDNGAVAIEIKEAVAGSSVESDLVIFD